MPKSKSREIIDRAALLAFIKSRGGAVHKRDIAKAFNLKGTDKIHLKAQLRDLAEEGLIAGRKTTKRPDMMPRIFQARVSEITEDGMVLAIPDVVGFNHAAVEITGPRADHLSNHQLVKVRILPGQDDQTGPKKVGLLHKISEDVESQIGVIVRADGKIWAEPVSRKGRGQSLHLVNPDMDKLRNGDLVELEILGRHRGQSAARIIEHLGTRLDSPRAVSMVAIHEHQIPHIFAQELLTEAEHLGATSCMREDLTDLPFATIDPEDARDHDDALYACPAPDDEGASHLYVAIADVAAFVATGSLIDHEARRRGNSVYFPDRVVPMLPERLSTDLCSLKQGVERLAFVCRMRIGADGTASHPKFMRARINVRDKFSYEDAQALIHQDTMPDHFACLLGTYRRMDEARKKRGPLELEVPEHKIRLDEDGRVAEINLRERFEAHKLVEECMIQANVAAGAILTKHLQPALYRVHEEPPKDRLLNLKTSFDAMGLPLTLGNRITPNLFNRAVARMADQPQARTISEMVLRCQTQAYYGMDNLGHFGLSLDVYAHFTSPIRRYADLMVHRALIRCLKLGPDGMTDKDMEALEQIGTHISKTERTAMAAERDSIARYVAAHMSDRIGMQFEATISGIARMGLFVQLVDNGAEGFIPIAKIGQDYYVYDEQTMVLRGEQAGLTFRLGEDVTVRLEEAAPVSGGLRFSLILPKEPPLRRGARRGHGSSANRGRRPVRPPKRGPKRGDK